MTKIINLSVVLTEICSTKLHVLGVCTVNYICIYT
jgi:hypothetical protein